MTLALFFLCNKIFRRFIDFQLKPSIEISKVQLFHDFFIAYTLMEEQLRKQCKTDTGREEKEFPILLTMVFCDAVKLAGRLLSLFLTEF